MSATRTVGRKAIRDLMGVAKNSSPATAARYFWAVATNLPAIFRSRKLVPADAAMAGHLCSFHVFGAEVVFPGEVFSGARELYCRKVYFELPQFRIHPGDVVVDLGANRGMFATLAGRTARKVIAVEAQHGFGAEIRQNAQRNGCSDVVSVELAMVGGETGMLADEKRLLAASHYEGVRVPRKSMREVLDAHGVERVNFMKIDIEGSEFDLLRNGVSEWLPQTDKLVMEVHGAFGDPHELEAVLRASGMQTRMFDSNLTATRIGPGQEGYLYGWRDAN